MLVMAPWVKTPAVQETEEMQVWSSVGTSLGWDDPREEKMATSSSILAWRIPWTEKPGGLQSMRSQRVKHNWSHGTFISRTSQNWVLASAAGHALGSQLSSQSPKNHITIFDSQLKTKLNNSIASSEIASTCPPSPATYQSASPPHVDTTCPGFCCHWSEAGSGWTQVRPISRLQGEGFQLFEVIFTDTRAHPRSPTCEVTLTATGPLKEVGLLPLSCWPSSGSRTFQQPAMAQFIKISKCYWKNPEFSHRRWF